MYTMKISIPLSPKKRNHLVVPTMMRKAGVHRESDGGKRARLKKETKKAAKECLI
jgi:hypothetical protein